MAGQDRVVMGDDGDSGLADVFDDLQTAILAQHQQLRQDLEDIKGSLATTGSQVRDLTRASYNPDRETLSAALNGVGEKLAAIEKRLAWQPSGYASQSLTGTVDPTFKQIQNNLTAVLEEHTEAMGRERSLRLQNSLLGVAFLLGLCIATLLLFTLPARISEGTSAHVAAVIMNMSMAEAGARMFRRAAPDTWDDYTFGFHIYDNNARSLTDCYDEMQYRREAQTCTIIIPTSLTRE